jgi:hypothetical protein
LYDPSALRARLIRVETFNSLQLSSRGAAAGESEPPASRH